MGPPEHDDVPPDPIRRRLLGVGLAGLAASELSSAAGAESALPWQRVPGAPFSPYGVPAAGESGVQRRIAANPAVPGNGASWTPLEDLDGIVTPSGLHFERHHNGVPAIDPARHRLRIDGLVRRPLEFDLDGLLRLPRVSRLCFIECGGNSNAGWRTRPLRASAGGLHGLVSCSEWSGVSLGTVLEAAEPLPGAAWLVAEGADAISMNISLPLAKARDDCLLALYQNGERLRPEQGYPLRLLVPGWEGVLNCKWLTRLSVTREPALGRNETARYTELMPDGRARMFTFTMAPKSLITWPAGEMTLPRAGIYEIRGLAWSGHGRVAQVDVSLDGGANWQAAALDGPVLPACLTRFRLPWHWRGGPAVLQSRVTDEHGNRQPGRAELLAARGDRGYFHYNAVVSWAIDARGEVRHVYVDAPPPDPDFEGLFLDEK